MANDDRILLNLVLNEATVSAVEGRVRNLVNRLNNTNISLNIDARNLNNIENQFNRIQQQMQTINATPVNINANLTSAQQQYRLETERIRVSQRLELSRQRTLQTENQAISALAQQNRTLTVNNNVTHQIEQGAQNIGNNMNVAGGHARDFVDYLADGVRYIIVYRSLYEIMNQIGEAFDELKNVDRELISVRKTTGMAENEIEKIRKSSYGVATEYGRTASEYLGSVSEFARGGYKELSTELAKVSLLTQNVGDVSADSANKMLLSVDAAYKLNGNVTELTNVVNGLNNIANLNPTSMQKMADGMQVSASMAKVAGLEISDLVALIGTGTAVTQREGGEIAKAIRTIMMNIRQVKGELEDGTVIDDDSIAKAEAALKGVGIATKEVVNGVRELRDPMDILDELAGKWSTLNTEAQSVILEGLANKRQANVLAAILENYEMVGKMQSEYFNSANSAVKENELYLQGWEATQKRVSAKWTEFIANMADTSLITGSLNALYGVLVALDTPIGRIATSIVLVNTALAVSGRLWQAIRARSIVADILSMGVAERNLGTAIQLVSGHLGRQIAQWAASPFGMATIAVAGITLITSAIEKNSQKLEENAQKAGEAYDKVKQNMNELDDLIKKYNDLQISNEWDNTPVETKKQLHEDINRLLGDEADKVDILNGKYKKTTEELFKQRMSKLPEEEKKAFDNEQAKGKSLWDTAYWNGGGGAGGYNYGTMQATETEKKFIEKYEKIFDKKYYSAGRGMGGTDYAIRFDNLDDFMMKYEEAKKMLQELYYDGMGESELYKGLNSFIAKFDTKVSEYKTAVEELKSTKAGQKLADYINTSVGGYVDDLDEYKIVVDWIKSNFTGKDADNALGLLNAYFSEYAKKISETNEILWQEGLSTSLSDLKTASEGVSALSSAFKQASDDGYMSIDSLSKIQEATKLSGEEWDTYQTKLMNAKVGSEEFNQIMSDLTYKILDATFKKDGLVDATEDEIAAVLRENNVANASAVAHDYVTRNVNSETKAKAQNAIETAKSSGTIDNFISNLSSEAEACGITTTALGDLVSSEIIFNNNDLSVSGKIAKLAALEMQVYGTAGAYVSLHNAMMNGTTSTSLLMDKGVKVTAKYTGDSSVPEYMRSANAYDYTYSLNGATYNNETDAWNAYLSSLWDKQKDEMGGKTPISITPSGGGSSGGGGGSDKNDALDNYLKYIKHKKALGYYDDNAKQYINDLQYALNNLTKTEEEQWDLEEQIYSERENLKKEEISGYESWMSHLENLGYYEDDIAKKINDVTWALENQQLTEEEKFKKEEEIYKLTLERNKKIRESVENLAKAHSETYNSALSDVERYIEQLEHQKALTDDDETIRAIDKLIVGSMTNGITKAEDAISNLTTDANYWKGEIANKLKELGASFDISKWFDYDGSLMSQFESDMDELNNSQAEEIISSWANIVSEKLKGVADNTDLIFEYQEKIFSDSKDAIKESISDIQDAAEEIFNLRTSKLNSQSTLLKAQHSLINSIAETQHQLDKDILEAETSGARMSERERELLFTRDEYNKLSGKLNDVLSEANDIQDEFNRKLKGATLDTIDEITNHYERQYELKMKEYEIVKAELDVAKAQQKLENVENEKSVRQWDGEKWVYTSVLQDVINAQNELADAKYQLAQAEIEQSQTEAIQEIDAKVDSIETQKNLFIAALEELTEGTSSAREKLNTALNEIADTDISLFRNIIDRVGETLSGLGAVISSVSMGEPVSSSGAVKVVSGIGNGGIHPVDANKASLKNTYAKGSRYTSRGIGLFDEDGLGSEIIVTKDGALRQFNAGETVFNSDMVQRLWDYASSNPIPWNYPNTNLSNISSLINKSQTTQPVYDNRTYFNGVEINDADGIRIMKEFSTYLKSKV